MHLNGKRIVTYKNICSHTATRETVVAGMNQSAQKSVRVKICVLGPMANLRKMPAYRVLQIFVRAIQINKVKRKTPQQLLISIQFKMQPNVLLNPPPVR